MPPDTEQPPVPAAPRRQVGHRGRGAGPVCRRRTCALLRGQPCRRRVPASGWTTRA